MPTHNDVEAALELAKRCKPVLAGHPPELQGVALAELVSLWLGGHHPDLRQAIWSQWLALVNELDAHNAQPLEAFARGCRRPLAQGQHWTFCGETDMGQTAPALCTECGGEYALARPQ